MMNPDRLVWERARGRLHESFTTVARQVNQVLPQTSWHMSYQSTPFFLFTAYISFVLTNKTQEQTIVISVECRPAEGDNDLLIWADVAHEEGQVLSRLPEE